MIRFLILFFLIFFSPFDAVLAQSCGKISGLTCPAPDADGDGYTTDGTLLGYDCNDSDWQQYPGVWREVGGYYSYCQTSGSWSTGTLTPNAATGSGANYFIDCDAAVNGTGSFASPWNSLKFVSSLSWAAPPSGWHNPVAGDAIWISGQCDELIDRDNIVGGESHLLFLLSRDGTSSNKIKILSWPGRARAYLRHIGSQINSAVHIEGSDYVELWGIEGSGFATVGVNVAELTNFKLEASYLHNFDGEANDNNSGITLSSVNNPEISRSIIKNNYDVEKCNVVASQNSRNITTFQGTGIKIKYNHVDFDDTCTQNISSVVRGIGGKHGDQVTKTNSSYEVSYNTILGSFGGIESGVSGSWLHHNYVESRTFCTSAEDVGGPTYLNNFVVEYNTCKTPIGVNIEVDAYSYLFSSISYVTVANYAALPVTGAANTIYTETENNRRYRWDGAAYQLVYNAYIAYVNLAAFPVTGALGTIYIANDSGVFYKWNGSSYVDAQNIYRHNVYVSNESAFNSEKAPVTDSVYASNTLYDLFSRAGYLDYRTNCYFNNGAATIVFNHFNSTSGGASKGAQYFLAGWQAVDTSGTNAKPAWDDDSFVENPLLNSIGRATSSNCSNKGYLAGLTGGGSPITSPTPSPTVSPSATPVSGKADFVKRRPWISWDW